MFNLIDIGAVGGLELPWRRKPELIDVVLSFEPNERTSFTDGRISYKTAVWNYDGDAEFTVYGENGVGSSLLKQNIQWVKDNFESIRHEGDRRLADTWIERSQPRGKFQCAVGKLDTILEDLRGKRPETPRFHFLKSDTQSGEWYVLDGARNYLATECIGLELECFRYPLYEGIKVEDQVFEMLADLGFDRWGWTGYKNSFNSQADYLFLKRDVSADDQPLVDQLKALYQTTGPTDIIKRINLRERIQARLSHLVGA